MSDLKANFDKLNNVCKEVNEKWENIMKENNPFDTISKIAKDIADRRDKEKALEFTKCIGKLLRQNGVTPMIEEYKTGGILKNDKIFEEYYGVAITGLDFTEHDKMFNDEISDLRKELRESKACITQLKNELQKKCSFETDRLVKLPFDALETANILINATYKAEIPFLEKQVDRDVYNIDDLEQIAEHLLVYCKHNKDSEE